MTRRYFLTRRAAKSFASETGGQVYWTTSEAHPWVVEFHQTLHDASARLQGLGVQLALRGHTG